MMPTSATIAMAGRVSGATIDPSGRFVFYTTVDEAWRPEKVWRHTVTGAGAGYASATDPTATPEAR